MLLGGSSKQKVSTNVTGLILPKGNSPWGSTGERERGIAMVVSPSSILYKRGSIRWPLLCYLAIIYYSFPSGYQVKLTLSSKHLTLPDTVLGVADTHEYGSFLTQGCTLWQRIQIHKAGYMLLPEARKCQLFNFWLVGNIPSIFSNILIFFKW